ncbi:unnamed protein product [Victoria cruziana]
MSPPFCHVEEGPGEVHSSADATFSDRTSKNGPVLTEHYYMRLSHSSSGDSSVVTAALDEKDDSLNLKATELTLGLPGSQSPVRSLDLSLSSNAKHGEKSILFPDPSEEEIPEAKQSRRNDFPILQTVLSDGSMFMGNSELELMSAGVKARSDTWHAGDRDYPGAAILSPRPSQDLLAKNVSVKHFHGKSPLVKENVPLKTCHDGLHVSEEFNVNSTSPAVDYEFSLVAKEQVVGWPPIRSYRKSTLSANSKSKDEVQEKPSSGPLLIKVSMDGAPYLRKVDLKTCATYDELSSSLEKMFSCFTIGRCGSSRVPSRDVLNDGKLMDFLNGSEYIITYEDEDGDWMLVGDVPWEMFVGFCKRIRIMKGCDAIGLAPTAMLKIRSGN